MRESQEEKTKGKETKTVSTGGRRVREEKEEFLRLQRLDLTLPSLNRINGNRPPLGQMRPRMSEHWE